MIIAHYTFDQIDDLAYPDVRQIIETFVKMKTGKTRQRRGNPDMPPPPNYPGRPLAGDRLPGMPRPDQPEQEFDSIQEEVAYAEAMVKENARVARETKHISTQPFWVQQAFANRNKTMDELFPPNKK